MVPKAEKGISVREQGEKWAEQKREKILLHPPSGAIRVTEGKNLKVFSFPSIAKEDKRSYTIRFSPFSGEIFVPIWRELSIKEEEGRRFLKTSQSLIQLRHPREKEVDFSNLPCREVVQLYYLRLPSIEAAIRQQVHIMDRYKEGKEAQQIEELMKWLNLQWQATAQTIDGKALEVLAQQTYQFLEISGLTTAHHPKKRNIGEILRNVYQKDSRGRVNPLAMRIRLRSAYLKAVEREMMPWLVSEKFTYFLGILLMEREITRQIISEAVEVLDTLAGITKRGAVVFKEFPPRYSAADLQGIEKVLKEVALSLVRVRVLPYLPAARRAAINLVGCREEKKELNRRIIGEQANKLFSLLSVVGLIRIVYFLEAKERIKNLSWDVLKQILEENKEIGVEISQSSEKVLRN